MKHILIFVFSLLLFTSCENKETGPIAPDKMAEVITELHIAEYYSQGLGDSTPTFKKNMDSLALFYKSILEHHQLSLAEFDEAYKWLVRHPEIMDTVYIKVNSNIESLRRQYKTSNSNVNDFEQQLKDGNKALNDSIKLAEQQKAIKDSLIQKQEP